MRGMKGAWVEVDLRRLDGNIAAMQGVLSGRTEPVLVVKADAYGHGLRAVVERAYLRGVRWFAVAYTAEGVAARAVAPEAKIVVLGAADAGDLDELVEHGLITVVIDRRHGEELAAAARQRGVTVPVHVKVDTGMGRFGVPWENAVADVVGLDHCKGIRVEGICTHFASVEVARPSLGPIQQERFQAICEGVVKRAQGPIFRHASSSRAFLTHREWDLDGVRPGIALYGYGASLADGRFLTRPVLSWKTRVLMVKKVPARFPVGYYSSYTTPAPTRIATVAAGYADGYHRLLSNRAMACVRGRWCKVVGRISMNWITLDVGLEGEVEPGDEVTLLGEGGGETFWADAMAKEARTIPYEVLTSIDPRAPRVYVG